MSDTVHLTVDHLALSVTPTAFETVHHKVEPIAGNYALQNGPPFPVPADMLGSSGNFAIVNKHDVVFTVTHVSGVEVSSFPVELHGRDASAFIRDLDHSLGLGSGHASHHSHLKLLA